MKIIVPLTLLALLTGCSDKSDPPESLLKGHKQTLDKARETDALLKGVEDQRREQLDQLEQ